MNKLLSADFTRLWKNKVFWLGAACMALLACWIICIGYGQNVRWADDIGFEPNRLDAYLFQFAPMIGGFAAVIISLFLGADYSDGTIRNKLIVGSRRRDIYLSNLVVCTAASLICMAAYLIGAFAVGIPLLGVPTADARMVLACILLCVLFTFSGIVVLTLVKNEWQTVIAVVLLSVSVCLNGFIQPLVAAEIFGRSAYNTTLGIMMAMLSVGGLLSSPLVNFSFDATGSYTRILIVLAVIAAVDALFLLPAFHAEAKYRRELEVSGRLGDAGPET